MNLLISDAWAQGGGSASPGSGLVSLLPIVVIFVLFYFLLIRPQQKRQKQQKEMIQALAKGDEVVTAGGTLGKVTEVGENFLTLEIAQGVQIKIQRTYVQQMMPKGTMKDA
jgi:preprotein translocase subunit YajC